MCSRWYFLFRRFKWHLQLPFGFAIHFFEYLQGLSVTFIWSHCVRGVTYQSLNGPNIGQYHKACHRTQLFLTLEGGNSTMDFWVQVSKVTLNSFFSNVTIENREAGSRIRKNSRRTADHSKIIRCLFQSIPWLRSLPDGNKHSSTLHLIVLRSFLNGCNLSNRNIEDVATWE